MLYCCRLSRCWLPLFQLFRMCIFSLNRCFVCCSQYPGPSSRISSFSFRVHDIEIYILFEIDKQLSIFLTHLKPDAEVLLRKTVWSNVRALAFSRQFVPDNDAILCILILNELEKRVLYVNKLGFMWLIIRIIFYLFTQHFKIQYIGTVTNYLSGKVSENNNDLLKWVNSSQFR